MAGKKRRKRSRGSPSKRRPPKESQRRSQWSRWTAVASAVAFGALLTFFARAPGEHTSGRVSDFADAETLAVGEALYADHCASCHGANLAGQQNWKEPLPDGALPAPPHDETGHTWHHPDDYLFETTKRGGNATAPAGYVSAMPGFEETLSDDEIWMVLDFIKSRWPADIRARQRARSR